MPRFTDADASGWEFTPGELARTREIVERLKAIRVERAGLDAEEAALQAEAMGIAIDQMGRMPDASVYEFPVRSMAAELALATRESPRAVQGRMDRAHTLVTRFPATHAALGEGRITSRHAQVIAEAGADLDEDAVRAAFESEILPLAEKATPHRTKALAARVAEKYQPVSATVRHEEARERRGVWVEDQPDGQAGMRCGRRSSRRSSRWRRRRPRIAPRRWLRGWRRSISRCRRRCGMRRRGSGGACGWRTSRTGRRCCASAAPRT
ncbi:hypothetical protein ASD19_05550 [Microbacterium sp. Root53]|nr:hypothetical protein ASD19_05550 [Microbacterium sp. Root53]